MAFELYDHVMIQRNQTPGEIIDIVHGEDGTTCYYVESDIEGYKDDPDVQIPGSWPIYECFEDDLKKI